MECRFDGYVYDGNQDDVDASEDADFSLKPCSKSKKKSLKKVQNLYIRMQAEVSVNPSKL